MPYTYRSDLDKAAYKAAALMSKADLHCVAAGPEVNYRNFNSILPIVVIDQMLTAYPALHVKYPYCTHSLIVCFLSLIHI